MTCISALPISGTKSNDHRRSIDAGSCQLCNDYNRSYLCNGYPIGNAQRCTLTRQRTPHFLSFVSLISPIIRHIVAHCRANETSNNFAVHFPLIQSHYIVHYSPLCLQIEWYRSRSREAFGGLGYPEGYITDIRQACISIRNGREIYVVVSEAEWVSQSRDQPHKATSR